MASSGSQKFAADLDFLRQAIASITTLIKTFQSALHEFGSNAYPSAIPSLPTTDTIDPLSLLSDASKLLEAQTTKLSLLILNEPFTPREIAHILIAVRDGCLPALASTLELCPSERYTAYLHRHLNTSLGRIWAELLELIGSIPSTIEAIRNIKDGKGKGTLASTGVLWAECRKLVALRTFGVTALFQREVRSNMALIADAISELEEWDPDAEDSDEEEEDEDPFSSHSASSKQNEARGKEARRRIINTPTTSEDEAANVANNMGKTLSFQQQSALALLKTRILKHLKLLRMLCEALNKRRVATFPRLSVSSSEHSSKATNNDNTATKSSSSLSPQCLRPPMDEIKTLDDIITQTQFFTSEADELAAELYLMETESVDKRLVILRDRAKSCAKTCRMGWDGEEDVFTAWSDKWVQRMEELGGEKGEGGAREE